MNAVQRAPLVLAITALSSLLAATGCSSAVTSHHGGDEGGGGPDLGAPVDPNADLDGDGYSFAQGDCNDHDPLINPGAFEVPGNGVDDNCNGEIDEATAACDGKTGAAGPFFAGAMELCAPWLVDAQWVGGDPLQRAIAVDYGHFYKPRAGGSFIVLSTGIAADEDDARYVIPDPGQDFWNADTQNPAPMNTANNVCGKSTTDEKFVHDYVELRLSLKVPTNARSLSFDFVFLSAEYPEWVGSDYNDKFLALLQSKSYSGNISFDKNTNPVTVNVGFFDACTSEPICGGSKTNPCTPGKAAELDGTGYELPDDNNIPIGGATGWLHTQSPVTPGETATLRLILFDEGDHILDSAVAIDNFQWSLDGSAGPVTIQ